MCVMAGSKYVTSDDLARFHRDVFIPDIERIVDEKVTVHVEGLRADMFKQFDRVFAQLEFLAVEYQATKGGLKRVEGRVAAHEKRIGVLEKKTPRL